jgi:hypothetical protein
MIVSAVALSHSVFCALYINTRMNKNQRSRRGGDGQRAGVSGADSPRFRIIYNQQSDERWWWWAG